jgi:hypothetical protein
MKVQEERERAREERELLRELHKAFAHRRVNFVNYRCEFCFATPAEVHEVLMQKVGGLLEFNAEPKLSSTTKAEAAGQRRSHRHSRRPSSPVSPAPPVKVD